MRFLSNAVLILHFMTLVFEKKLFQAHFEGLVDVASKSVLSLVPDPGCLLLLMSMRAILCYANHRLESLFLLSRTDF